MDESTVVYERIAEGLARLGAPNLSELDSGTVSRAMMHVISFSGPNRDWLQWLKDKVSSISKEAVRIEEEDPNSFPFLIKEPGTLYLRVLGLGRSRLATVNAAYPPVHLY